MINENSNKLTPLTIEESLIRGGRFLGNKNVILAIPLKDIDISWFDSINESAKNEILKRSDIIYHDRNNELHFPPVVSFIENKWKVLYWGFDVILAYKKAKIDENRDIYCICCQT